MDSNSNEPQGSFRITENKRIIIDIDGTICREKKQGECYSLIQPNIEIIAKLHEYKEDGFYIILYSSRQMRTYNNNIGQINANTLPVIIDWLKQYNVPYNEIIVGKPWCGFKGFYVDDKAIRPDEFLNLSYNEIKALLHIGD
jgi:capsule biosynthesis phosphatase